MPNINVENEKDLDILKRATFNAQLIADANKAKLASNAKNTESALNMANITNAMNAAKKPEPNKENQKPKVTGYGVFDNVINSIANYGSIFANYFKSWGEKTTTAFENQPKPAGERHSSGFGGIIGMIFTGISKIMQFIFDFVQSLVAGKQNPIFPQSSQKPQNSNVQASSSQASSSQASSSQASSSQASCSQASNVNYSNEFNSNANRTTTNASLCNNLGNNLGFTSQVLQNNLSLPNNSTQNISIPNNSTLNKFNIPSNNALSGLLFSNDGKMAQSAGQIAQGIAQMASSYFGCKNQPTTQSTSEKAQDPNMSPNAFGLGLDSAFKKDPKPKPQ